MVGVGFRPYLSGGRWVSTDKTDDLTVDPQVAESYQEANERGANAKGEGRIP